MAQGDWIDWSGGSIQAPGVCPVDDNTEIHVRCRDNSEYTTNIPQYVDGWAHSVCANGYEIIAYKVVDLMDPD